MKRVKLVWLFSTMLTLTLMAAASWAQEPDPGDEGGSPPPPAPAIQGVGLAGVSQEFASSLDGAFIGTAFIALNGERVPVTITSEPLVLADSLDNFGRLVGTKTTLLDFGDGNTLTTSDVVLLTRTGQGFFSAQETMTILGGTGFFAGASGFLDAYGIFDTNDSMVHAQWLIEGTVLT
jgi:hypothetical protein